MVTNRTPIRRQRRPLSTFQEMDLNHGGVAGERSPFESEEDRQAAWERHRDYLMAKCTRGFRPTGFWDYDAPQLGIRRPARLEYEAATLWEHGLLSEEETATLEAEWRQHFDDANAPDFIRHCTGYDKVKHCAIWAKGAEARKAHYKWAGLPKTLLARWSSELGRPARTRRTVKPASPKPATSSGDLPPTSTPPSSTPLLPPLIG